MLRESLKSQFGGGTSTINDALELLDEANQKLKHMATEAGEAALDTTRDVAGRAFSMSKKTARKIDKSAHENAWKYVGFASALSALAGYYLGRCARD